MTVDPAPAARAVWFAAPRRVELREEALPVPGAGEVRVRALVSALSHGTEMLVYRGEVPPDLPLDLPTLAGAFAFPIKYGYASVGRVETVGAGVDRPARGDLVFTHHPHQTAYVVPAALPVVLSPGADPEAAVFLANLETAVNVMLDAAPRVGEIVVILGQGVVGLLLTQLAARTPGVTVVAVEPAAVRRELSRALGAAVVVDPARDDAAAIARDLTTGRGADLVLEVSGNPDALQAAVDAAGMEARVVVASWYGTKPATLGLGGAFHRKRLRLISSQVGQVPGEVAHRWDVARRRAVAAGLLAGLTLTPLISHRIPFERAAEAYALVDRGAEDAVQVVLTYGEAPVP